MDLLWTWETDMNQPPWRPRSWMEQWGGWKCCPAGYLWKGSKLLMICTIPRLSPWLHAKTCKKHRKSLRRTHIYVNWWLIPLLIPPPPKKKQGQTNQQHGDLTRISLSFLSKRLTRNCVHWTRLGSNKSLTLYNHVLKILVTWFNYGN